MKYSPLITKVMQVIEIEESLMAEICEAANFEEKSCAEYINQILLNAIKNYRREKQIARQYAEAYGRFPQELDYSDEEFAKWKEIFERSEK
jgi:hypothetical protein